MPSENLFTDTEILKIKVREYWIAHLDLIAKHPQLKQRSDLLENMLSVLEILSQTKQGRMLLASISTQCNGAFEISMHQSFEKLMEFLFTQKKAMESLSKFYQSKGMIDLLIGTVTLVTGPSFFIYVLPLLTNPVIFALVFLSTCIILPLIANLIINCSVNHLSISHLMKNTFMNENSHQEQKALYNRHFFKNNTMSDAALAFPQHTPLI